LIFVSCLPATASCCILPFPNSTTPTLQHRPHPAQQSSLRHWCCRCPCRCCRCCCRCPCRCRFRCCCQHLAHWLVLLPVLLLTAPAAVARSHTPSA
jgi:hypothetical protein